MFCGELIVDLLPPSLRHRAAGREGQLEVVAGQALVRRALVDDPALLGGVGIDLLPCRRRRAAALVGAVVDEGRVAGLGNAPVLVGVVHRLERRGDVLRLLRLDVGGQVVQPLLAGELGRPDHVGAEDVAVVGLGLLALDELGALLVSGRRELGQRGLVALRGEFGVEVLDDRLARARRVLALAVLDRPLGRVVQRLGVDDLRALDLDAAASSRTGGATAAASAAAAAAVAAATGGQYDAADEHCTEPELDLHRSSSS